VCSALGWNILIHALEEKGTRIDSNQLMAGGIYKMKIFILKRLCSLERKELIKKRLHST
jgi:hypothetical protein